MRTLSPQQAPEEPAGTARAWQLVAVREVLVKLSDKTFVFSTLGTVVLIAALLGFQAYLADRAQTYTVVASPGATAMAQAVRDGAPQVDENVVVDVREVPDDDAARAQVSDGEADAWLHPAGGGWLLTTRSQAEGDLESVTRQVIRLQTLQANAAAAGTTLEAMERGSQLEADFLEGDAQQAQLAQAIGFAFAMLFYIAALLFGVTLANSVLEEKQSRIVEIIATAVPLRQLLAGKVIGNLAIAVVQLSVYLAVGLIGLSFTDYSSLVPSLSGPVVWFVLFFLAGFAVLACLWAVAGSLANRSEDLQATTAPLTVLTIAVFFSALLLQGQWLTVASFVPPLSAVLMPTRLVQGTAPWWQAAIALAVLVVTAAVTVRIGERLYRRSLLQTGGGRISLRTAWRAEE